MFPLSICCPLVHAVILFTFIFLHGIFKLSHFDVVGCAKDHNEHREDRDDEKGVVEHTTLENYCPPP